MSYIDLMYTLVPMKILRIPFFVLLTFVGFSAIAQTSNQPDIISDSITFDINTPHYTPEAPAALFLNELEAPTVYLLNQKKIELEALTALDVNSILSIRILQDPKEIEQKGYTDIRSLVLIATKEK